MPSSSPPTAAACGCRRSAYRPAIFEFSVSDTGIGIAEKDLRRLFLPFEQLDGSLARKYEGTGLGLSMVKRLAELHGGTVSVSSVPGRGSRFALCLPLRSPAVTQAFAPVPGAIPAGA